jgi:hypothetical protein
LKHLLLLDYLDFGLVLLVFEEDVHASSTIYIAQAHSPIPGNWMIYFYFYFFETEGQQANAKLDEIYCSCL